jgi:exosome complex RNA-binding protein Rrp4
MAGRLELHQKKEGKKLIAKHLKTVYFAKEGENVIGVIVKRNAESYNIDISMAF